LPGGSRGLGDVYKRQILLPLDMVRGLVLVTRFNLDPMVLALL
jgi:hypothetical protein